MSGHMQEPRHSALISEVLARLVEFRDLTRAEAASVMEEIMSGAAHDSQIAGLLTALRMKGETVEELVGFAEVLRSKVVPVSPLSLQNGNNNLVDTCGTGGDSGLTFNVSTAAAFVAAGAGLRVA
jgi:anthranilate phosphoribosyltransferase